MQMWHLMRVIHVHPLYSLTPIHTLDYQPCRTYSHNRIINLNHMVNNQNHSHSSVVNPQHHPLHHTTQAHVPRWKETWVLDHLRQGHMLVGI
jgi:hypothetical protein